MMSSCAGGHRFLNISIWGRNKRPKRITGVYLYRREITIYKR